MSTTRRQFLLTGAALAAALPARAGAPALLPASASSLPRWRGFNLLEKYTLKNNGPFREWDFDFIAESGFNFIRLPMDYRIWTRPAGGIDEAPLKEIDQALDWARARGIHLCLCLHRAPGYCINPPKEPLDLWADDAGGGVARQAFAAQWRLFAARYRGVPSDALSFDLVNEPGEVTGAAYHRVANAAVTAIREEDPQRLVIADGTGGGRNPVPELASLGIAQSGRGYEPFSLTHFQAPWVKGADAYPVPTWPAHDPATGQMIDRETLRQRHIAPWQALQRQGVGVMVGEWGVYRHTPHPVTLAWMADVLANWRDAGWGWSLWNLRGDFGPLDSRRSDVRYEDRQGRQLDRAMLDLLRAG